MLTGSVLITGGAGTLGREIIRRAHDEKWDCKITIFSTDYTKHLYVKALWPDVHCITGDIRDPVSIYNAMVGKDIVIHAAAVKHIPDSEWNSIDTYQINVEGSLNVCVAALQLNTPHVVGISTDKACHPANAYGATKYLMEKIFQEYSRLNLPTQFHLVRYGNVLESTASVIEVWKKAILNNRPIQITSPDMTRFWISPHQAVDYVVEALNQVSGNIYIPKMGALSVGKLAQYTLGEENYVSEIIPLRPGEKMHETLLTIEETKYAANFSMHFTLFPTTETSIRALTTYNPYSSDTAPELTREDLLHLLENK